ncbi:MAG: sialate O-acetylesterase [Verrucomicrobiota bacterium]
MKKIKNFLLIIVSAFIGYQAHKADLFPVSDFIERQFAEEISETQIEYAVYSDTSGKAEVGCPDPKESLVFAIMGQSNAANNGGHSFANENPNIINFFNGKCYIAHDPLLGSSGARGSLWLPFAEALKTDKKIVLVPLAVNSSKVGQWLADDGLMPLYQKTIDSVRKAGFTPSIFMWMQGESDRDLEKEEYKDSLESFFSKIKKQFPDSRIALSGTSYCGEEAPQIVQAQQDIAERNGYIWLGKTDQFIDTHYRYDSCHLSEQGMRAISGMFSKNINKAMK